MSAVNAKISDMTGVKLGICFVPTFPPEQLRAYARDAEAAGLDQLWVWEDCFSESGIATAAVALASTDRIEVGIGLLPVPLRNVALTAMELATLDRMFPGRFVPGVGHGVQNWMDQVGGRVSSPLTLLREYVTALRRLLAGDEVSVNGRYVQLDRVKLDWPPVTPPRLLVGGAGPKSMALAAELGDGNLLSVALTDDEVREAAEIARRHTRQPDRHELVIDEIAATGPDARSRLDAELAFWGKTPVTGIGSAGDADDIAARIRHLADIGATSIVFQPTQDEPDLNGFLTFLGQEVKSRLG
jgi:5,10-methylenetetrahydromethanopterin reductase